MLFNFLLHQTKFSFVLPAFHWRDNKVPDRHNDDHASNNGVNQKIGGDMVYHRIARLLTVQGLLNCIGQCCGLCFYALCIDGQYFPVFHKDFAVYNYRYNILLIGDIHEV